MACGGCDGREWRGAQLTNPDTRSMLTDEEAERVSRKLFGPYHAQEMSLSRSEMRYKFRGVVWTDQLNV